jgi:hypothetical protein
VRSRRRSRDSALKTRDAEPVVRIHFPPAKSLQTMSSAAAEAAVVNFGDDAAGFVFARFLAAPDPTPRAWPQGAISTGREPSWPSRSNSNPRSIRWRGPSPYIPGTTIPSTERSQKRRSIPACAARVFLTSDVGSLNRLRTFDRGRGRSMVSTAREWPHGVDSSPSPRGIAATGSGRFRTFPPSPRNGEVRPSRTFTLDFFTA